MRRLVLASANPKKVAELSELMEGKFEIVPRPVDAPETIEDKDTLVGNAIKKAAEIAAFTGAPALADDTGLFVNALGGEPGVYSARYAGPECDAVANVAKLLLALEGVDDRAAYFETVIAVVWPDGRQVLADGKVLGSIGHEPVGEGGFGYDPVFIPTESDGRTFAQMPSSTKAEISHRARALANVIPKLDEVDE